MSLHVITTLFHVLEIWHSNNYCYNSGDMINPLSHIPLNLALKIIYFLDLYAFNA